MTKIPKLLHFCFGLDPSFGGKPWSLIHHVCVSSAIERLRPTESFIYYEYEPSGPWWECSRKLLTPVQISAPREIFGRKLEHVAHRADVLRLQMLIEKGGIYLDADVFVHRSFDELLDNSVVLGEEGIDGQTGLGNAVILAEPGAKFLKRWHAEYRSFRSKGKDEYWGEHSIQLPQTLRKQHPKEVTVLPHTAFYWPLWTDDGLQLIYGSSSDPEQRSEFANHLWESNAWEKYLEFLTPAKVRGINSAFHVWARPLVADLPDNYGSPSLLARIRRRQRMRQQRSNKVSSQIVTKLERIVELGIVGSLRRMIEKGLCRVRGTTHRRGVFRRVYSARLWGAETNTEFYSGQGSRGEAADTYVQRMSDIILHEASSGRDRPVVVVDLGCGDFEVGRGLIGRVGEVRYIGCDIVPGLINHHVSRERDARAEFRCLDIVADELPDGDICLVRQVFQHLSNKEISMVLRKLGKYKTVYVSEAYPTKVTGLINPDKRSGADVRYDWQTGLGRGVELDKPPFCLSTRELFRVAADSKQVIVTFEVTVSRRFALTANHNVDCITS
jgi:Glycosyltransferase sugar-binding region containing DXD motif